jgi:hypothetical protein
MLFGKSPFNTATDMDPLFKLLIDKRYKEFWNEHKI